MKNKFILFVALFFSFVNFAFAAPVQNITIAPTQNLAPTVTTTPITSEPAATGTNQISLDIIKNDVNKAAKYRIFYLDAPSRLVIDIKNAQLADNFDKHTFLNDNIKNVRVAKHSDGTLRVVFDLNSKMFFTEHKVIGQDPKKMQLNIELSATAPQQGVVTTPKEKVEKEDVVPTIPATPVVPNATNPVNAKSPVITNMPTSAPSVSSNETANPSTIQSTVGVKQLNALIKKDQKQTNGTNKVPVVKAFGQENNGQSIDIK